MALREAITNAVAHKSYASGNPIQISVYDDKVMIWNEGQLPENWTVSKLLQKHASVPYNPAIASAFFWAGYIESWGRGTLKIINECRKSGVPDPNFTYDPPGFWVEFHAKEEKGVTESVTESEITNAILQSIRENNKITIRALEKKLGFSKRSIEWQLNKLKETAKIKRIGSNKGGYWEILT